MPRLRRKTGIRSEHHGAKGRARKGDIARRAMSPGRCQATAVGRGLAVCTGKRSAQRASASGVRQGSSPERRRPRSGLRGAGRGEAAPGGIEPGDRSEGPGGRPDLPTGGADDKEPSLATEGDGQRAEGFEEPPNRASSDRLVAALDATIGGVRSEGVAVVAREARHLARCKKRGRPAAMPGSAPDASWGKVAITARRGSGRCRRRCRGGWTRRRSARSRRRGRRP